MTTFTTFSMADPRLGGGGGVAGGGGGGGVAGGGVIDGISSLVIVQVLLSLETRVMYPLELQSPLKLEV
jgi:hypothetical protein